MDARKGNGGKLVRRMRRSASGGLDGRHEVRLDRIEDSLKVLHKKLDRIADESAVARTDVAWLKWGMRVLFAAVLGVGSIASQAVL